MVKENKSQFQNVFLWRPAADHDPDTRPLPGQCRASRTRGCGVGGGAGVAAQRAHRGGVSLVYLFDFVNDVDARLHPHQTRIENACG